MASLGISSPDCWPRMRSDVENPFQNAPGPFIYALPNLAGPRLSLSAITIDDCSLDRCAPPPDGRHHSYHNPAATSLDLLVESADLDPELSFVPQPHFIIFDEDEDDDDTQQREQQQERSCSGTSTPTPSQTSSGTCTRAARSEFSGEKEEEEEDDDGSEGSPKEKEKRKRRSGKGARRRRRNRQRSQQGGCAMGPRVMGLPGIHHIQLWRIQHSLPEPSPSLPLPGAMAGPGVFAASHAQGSSWYPGGGGYDHRGYAANKSGATWLVPAVPVPGLFGLPAS